MIAAGFQYREIKDVSCLPDCFSRPLSEYAIYLNDFMMHRVRNELLAPFVTRLPGTSDAPWIEEQRARLIVVETVRRIVAAEYDEVWRKPKLAAKCRAVQLFEQVSPAMAKAQAVLPLECTKQALKGLRGCLHPDLRVGSPCAAAAQAAARSFRKRFGPGADRKIWEMAALILEEAILFGRFCRCWSDFRVCSHDARKPPVSSPWQRFLPRFRRGVWLPSRELEGKRNE